MYFQFLTSRASNFYKVYAMKDCLKIINKRTRRTKQKFQNTPGVFQKGLFKFGSLYLICKSQSLSDYANCCHLTLIKTFNKYETEK